MSLIKHCTLLHTNFALFIFSFMLLFYQYNYDLTHTHASNCRSISTMDLIDNSFAIVGYDFENQINQAEDEGEEDCEVLGELARLLQ